MSVIVKDLQADQIVLFCKGAEVSVFKMCSSGDLFGADLYIDKAAKQGYRTLALAYKIMSEAEYAEAAARLNAAHGDLSQRNTLLSDAFEVIESNMVLIGATAVEDKLQDQVAETIEFLRKGGIKVWVLTGDKKETVIEALFNLI
jgi:phospholipid-translocating ATPase